MLLIVLVFYVPGLPIGPNHGLAQQRPTRPGHPPQFIFQGRPPVENNHFGPLVREAVVDPPCNDGAAAASARSARQRRGARLPVQCMSDESTAVLYCQRYSGNPQ
eukprot:SAG22_NODE_4699_length_1188_cov_2.060606_2_plen_105_part_00